MAMLIWGSCAESLPGTIQRGNPTVILKQQVIYRKDVDNLLFFLLKSKKQLDFLVYFY